MRNIQLDPIDKSAKNVIEAYDFMIMRDKRTKLGLNVSYTEDGLKWTVDDKGKLLYYKNAYLRFRKNYNGEWKPYIEGDTSKKNPNIIIEKFSPMNHVRFFKDKDGKLTHKRLNKRSKAYKNQKAEYTWVNKATKLLYVTENNARDFGVRKKLVYSSAS